MGKAYLICSILNALGFRKTVLIKKRKDTINKKNPCPISLAVTGLSIILIRIIDTIITLVTILKLSLIGSKKCRPAPAVLREMPGAKSEYFIGV